MENEPVIDPSKVLDFKFEETENEYTERDVALYALGVGAASSDPCDPSELPYVYNSFFDDNFKVLPTFAVLFPADLIEQFLSIDGLVFEPKLLLHGEQYLEIFRPLPPRAKVRNSSRVSRLEDKGKAALLEVETLSTDATTGEPLCINRTTCFLRGAGGFSTVAQNPPQAPEASQPATSGGNGFPARAKRTAPMLAAPKDTPPDGVHEEATHVSQALLYRLSGDYNPLHADPEFAAGAGFGRPILHGLCTLGFAMRAVIKVALNGESERFVSVQARFLLHVFPGESIITEMWFDHPRSRIIFQCKVKERGKVVLAGIAAARPSLPARL